MGQKKRILLSFVGTNDMGQMGGKEDGAILTALKEENYDLVYLLWNRSGKVEIDYEKIVGYVADEIIKRKYASNVQIFEFKISDVTDHNQIYARLKSFTDQLEKSPDICYTAAISSGTPSMQVCWILLAESGDFSEQYPLNLIRIRDPKFGRPSILPVKLDTSLPRIVSLGKEIESLKRDLIPIAKIDVVKGSLSIGGTVIKLSPIEFAYYRYFAEKTLKENELVKFSGFSVSKEFLEKVVKYHKESFPDLDTNRLALEKMLKRDELLAIETFRGNISKTNKKLKNQLKSETLYSAFEIKGVGIRGARFYGIQIDPEKIEILR